MDLHCDLNEYIQNQVCKILKDNGVKGTGFFCKIPYENNLLPVLITNNHVLNSKDINVTNNITISLNDNKEFKHIEIDNSRKLFTNEELDVTIIEIKANKDKIHPKAFSFYLN